MNKFTQSPIYLNKKYNYIFIKIYGGGVNT